MKPCNLLLAVLGATVLLGALASNAFARSFRITPNTQRATFREYEFTGGFGTTRCQVTLESSFHSETVSKVLETLIGYITRAQLAACAVGSATILTETLPWHIRYGGFTGLLPAISIFTTRIIGNAFRIREPFGITCLAVTTAAEPRFERYRREAGGVLTEVEVSGEIRTGAECLNVRGILRARSTTLTTLGSATRITVTLI